MNRCPSLECVAFNLNSSNAVESLLIRLFSLLMLVQTAHINGTTREEYDSLLARGWFRSTGIIYKSDIVCLDDQIYSVQHIRLSLADFVPRKKQGKMARRNADIFRMTVGNPNVNAEKERLYSQQSKRFKAFIHPTLDEMFSSGPPAGEFETKELCVYDGDKLVAVSYFDVGKESMASIMCLYDQEYQGYSLGIFTMLAEISYGQQQGIAFYYPGYILDRPSSFDYKLSLGPCEWMSTDEVWYEQAHFPKLPSKGDFIREKMAELQVKLALLGYQSEFRIYPYFTVGQIMAERPSLLKVPCYYDFVWNDHTLSASYDPELEKMMVFDLVPVYDLEFSQHLHLSDDYAKSEIYQLQLMRCNFYIPLEELGEMDVSVLQMIDAQEDFSI